MTAEELRMKELELNIKEVELLYKELKLERDHFQAKAKEYKELFYSVMKTNTNMRKALRDSLRNNDIAGLKKVLNYKEKRVT